MGDRLGIRDVVDIFVGSLLASVKQMQKVCATEAQWYKHLSQPQQRAIGCAVQEKVLCTHGGTRTHNLRFRKPTPYPLGHAGTAVKLGWWQEHTNTDQCREKLDGRKKMCVARESNPGRKNGNLAWYHYTSDAACPWIRDTMCLQQLMLLWVYTNSWFILAANFIVSQTRWEIGGRKQQQPG